METHLGNGFVYDCVAKRRLSLPTQVCFHVPPRKYDPAITTARTPKFSTSSKAFRHFDLPLTFPPPEKWQAERAAARTPRKQQGTHEKRRQQLQNKQSAIENPSAWSWKNGSRAPKTHQKRMFHHRPTCIPPLTNHLVTVIPQRSNPPKQHAKRPKRQHYSPKKKRPYPPKPPRQRYRPRRVEVLTYPASTILRCSDVQMWRLR